jgi:hypothetical protein
VCTVHTCVLVCMCAQVELWKQNYKKYMAEQPPVRKAPSYPIKVTYMNACKPTHNKAQQGSLMLLCRSQLRAC